ncbi:MAG TPA: hypothetical protein V6D47_12535 [Oscillatoriaceae cyanobacterium]
MSETTVTPEHLALKGRSLRARAAWLLPLAAIPVPFVWLCAGLDEAYAPYFQGLLDALGIAGLFLSISTLMARPRNRFGAIGGIALCLVLVPACHLLVGIFANIQEQVRDLDLRENADVVCAALDKYAKDHHGAYPPANDWLSRLSAAHKGYLPGDRLPPVRWASPMTATQHEALEVRTDRFPLVTAGEIARRHPPTPLGTDVGAGHWSADGRFDHATFGAIIYDDDPATRTYVVYAVGRRHDRAIIVQAATNVPW